MVVAANNGIKAQGIPTYLGTGVATTVVCAVRRMVEKIQV